VGRVCGGGDHNGKFRDDDCRCFLHQQITGSTRSLDSSFKVVSRTNEHTRVYPGSDPSIEIKVIRLTG
jgi:hypothetical protein